MILILRHDQNLLTANIIRRLCQLGFTLGMEFFEDTHTGEKYFKGLIHPNSVSAVFDSSYNSNTVDLHKYESEQPAYKFIQTGGIRFTQTTGVDYTMIFAKNSDPLAVRDVYLTESGDLEVEK